LQQTCFSSDSIVSADECSASKGPDVKKGKV